MRIKEDLINISIVVAPPNYVCRVHVCVRVCVRACMLAYVRACMRTCAHPFPISSSALHKTTFRSCI